MSDRVIETRGLRKQFGRKLAVADLSLSVGRGEVFGFLGPNGAGKTTSLKMLLGLVEPTAGTATVLGAPLGNRSIRARLGFLPEHFRFHDWLTGRELLRFHGELLGIRRAALDERIDRLLERVDLLDAAPRKLREYSKGMLQRIGLAQALLNDPEVVFLDEPTSGLDPLGRLLVRDIIRDLKARGTAVFLNSHLLGEVEATCDRVVFVKQGRAIRSLSLSAGGEDFEVELRFTPMSAELLEGLGRLGGSPAHYDGAVRLRVRSEESIPEIARWLVERGARIYRLESRRPSLESTFLEVMGQDQRPG
ncbi:MAG: ABC transporter ATP-binding protein [Candidatus Eisenbacteria bacterium]|nr:ABC transporter ATP-binding protein [Candidatus Eisenbacteria bacterium]